jgi:hypothetical protein
MDVFTPMCPARRVMNLYLVLLRINDSYVHVLIVDIN